jgi:hypothetical protein
MTRTGGLPARFMARICTGEVCVRRTTVPGAGFDSSASAAAIVPPEGRISGSGRGLGVSPAQNNAYRAISRAWALGGRVTWADGRFVIDGLTPPQETELVKSLALVAERTEPGVDIRRPRVGVFQPWTASMDEGWTRWVLEQYGIEYSTLHVGALKVPLAGRVDVLILADDARVPIEGQEGGRGRTRAALRPEYAERLSADDVASLETFVRSGGTLVCLNHASAFAIQALTLPVRNVVAGLRPEEFFLHGSIVAVKTDPHSPIMAGMPATAPVFADNSPVFELQDGFTGRVLSGYLIGEQYLNGKAAAVDVTLGAGHVVLLGFRPEWRGQSFGTFKVLFNAALLAGPMPIDAAVR